MPNDAGLLKPRRMLSPVRPDALMLLVWVALVAIYFVTPIQYQLTPGWMTWMVVAGGVGLYSLGNAIDAKPSTHRTDARTVEIAIYVCAALGFLGILCILVDKFALSGIDWSQGFRAVRDRRSEELLAGIAVPRSGLLYAGYLSFSFSCVAFALFILDGDRISRLAGLAGLASAAPEAIYAVLYGGRFPILIVILLAVSAGMVRRLQGRSFFPGGWLIWPAIAATAVGLAIYTNAIFENTRVRVEVVDFDQFMARAAERWYLRPSEWVIAAVASGTLSASAAMNGISVAMYLTHSLTVLERIMNHLSELSIYGGLYQVGVLSPLFDQFAPYLDFPAKMRRELIGIDIYGWYPSAWGAWIADAGIYAGAVCVFLWGLGSGLAFRKARDGDVSWSLMLIFVYTSVFYSPIQAPFGIANSFLIFGSFLAAAAAIALVRRWTRSAPAPATA